MKKEFGDWRAYRRRLSLTINDEVNLHFGRRELGTSYHEVMAEVESIVAGTLAKAHADGREWVMYIHGWSTSRPGKTTARSVVRQFMRSKDATPFIVRSECIMHDTVFIAKLRKT
jgi:hypothetical protein